MDGVRRPPPSPVYIPPLRNPRPRFTCPAAHLLRPRPLCPTRQRIEYRPRIILRRLTRRPSTANLCILLPLTPPTRPRNLI